MLFGSVLVFGTAARIRGSLDLKRGNMLKSYQFLCERAKDWLSSDEDLMVGVLMAFIRKRANYDEHGCRTHCVGMPGTLPEALALLNSQN